MLPAYDVFGMKFFSLTQKHSPDCDCLKHEEERPTGIKNAFDFLMKSSALNDEASMPKIVSDPSDSKEKIKN